jgi:hypothetical protein
VYRNISNPVMALIIYPVKFTYSLIGSVESAKPAYIPAHAQLDPYRTLHVARYRSAAPRSSGRSE